MSTIVVRPQSELSEQLGYTAEDLDMLRERGSLQSLVDYATGAYGELEWLLGRPVLGYAGTGFEPGAAELSRELGELARFVDGYEAPQLGRSRDHYRGAQAALMWALGLTESTPT